MYYVTAYQECMSAFYKNYGINRATHPHHLTKKTKTKTKKEKKPPPPTISLSLCLCLSYCINTYLVDLYLKQKMNSAQPQVLNSYGWAATDSSGILSPFHFARRFIQTLLILVMLQIYIHICIIYIHDFSGQFHKYLNLCTHRANGDDDITIKVLYCGICHTDLHLAKDELGMTIYPLVPGYIYIILFLL